MSNWTTILTIVGNEESFQTLRATILGILNLAISYIIKGALIVITLSQKGVFAVWTTYSLRKIKSNITFKTNCSCRIKYYAMLKKTRVR